MMIETYEIEPEMMENGEVETDEEALKLIEKLELDGQKALVKKDEESGDDSRLPYAEMTKQERGVYRACFPSQEKISAYRATAIPTRVLQVIAHAQQFFDYLEIWHERECRDPDPVLVGVMSENSYTQRYYLLARWGEALAPFSELVERGKEKLTRKFKQALIETRAKVDEFERLLDYNVIRALDGEWVHVP